MKRYACVAVIGAMLIGCGGSEGDDVFPGAPGAVDAAPDFDFTPFTPRTRSFALSEFQANHYLSITSAFGLVACGLANDPANSLGREGYQVIMNVTHPVGVPCPQGNYTVPSTCPDTIGDSMIAPIAEGCAYFREWDRDGNLLGELKASAGSLVLTGDESSCDFAVEMYFDGNSFIDSFTLTDGLLAQPWCTE